LLLRVPKYLSFATFSKDSLPRFFRLGVVLAPHPTPELGDHLLSAARDWLFNSWWR